MSSSSFIEALQKLENNNVPNEGHNDTKSFSSDNIDEGKKHELIKNIAKYTPKIEPIKSYSPRSKSTRIFYQI